MRPVSTLSSDSLLRSLLLYLVILGSIPFLDGLFTYPQSPEGFHPRHNVHLGWKLAHAIPALVGIGVALSMMSRSPMSAFPAVAILALQIAMGIADFRRIGFNAAVPREFSLLQYLAVAAALALPFALHGIYRWHSSRNRRWAIET